MGVTSIMAPKFCGFFPLGSISGAELLCQTLGSATDALKSPVEDQQLLWRIRNYQERARDALFEKVILLILWKGNHVVFQQFHLHRQCFMNLLSFVQCPHA